MVGVEKSESRKSIQLFLSGAWEKNRHALYHFRTLDYRSRGDGFDLQMNGQGPTYRLDFTLLSPSTEFTRNERKALNKSYSSEGRNLMVISMLCG